MSEEAQGDVVLWRNPACGTSRNTLAMIRTAGVEPVLINRPFVVSPRGARLCRPSEVVLEILPRPLVGDVVKEDGEAAGAG